MIFVCTHSVLGQSIESVILIFGIDPSAHVIEHFSLDWAAILEGRMMKYIKELLDHLLSVDACIVPCLYDTLNNVPDYQLGNLTGWLVQYHVEMVLG